MATYIIKSIACLFLFWAFYKLCLENLSNHWFKRWFLLLSIGSSLIIPAITFTEYVVFTPQVYANVQTTANDSLVLEGVASTQVSVMDTINWSMLFLSIYGIGLFVFGFRLFKNLGQILLRIKQNIKIKQGYGTKVLLKDILPPHTFFSYIFLNKQKFEANNIPKEVLLHEEIHAKQWHSIDVIFIELLQVLFWFNPMVFLFKNAIKLNHEFLADSAVIKKTKAPKAYQNTLLSYLSKESENKYQSIKMANAINYSSIKKRFKIMKKESPKKTVLLRTMLVFPLFALLLLGFSETKQIPVPGTSNTKIMELAHENPKRFILLIADSQIILNEEHVALDVFAQTVDNLTEDWEETDYTSIPVQANFSNTPMAFLEKVEFEFLKTHFSKSNEGMRIFPKGYQNQDSQEGVSEKLIKEYNALAKKYNEMDRDNMHILGKEVERLSYIYNLMTEKQKSEAEPYPTFPLPPDPPIFRSPPEVRKLPPTDGKDSVIEKIIKEQDPYDEDITTKGVTPTTKIYYPKNTKAPKPPKETKAPGFPKNPSGEKEIGIQNSTPQPPKPPKPIAPVDHIIAMAKKGASFYYEGKAITSDKAIELIKNNAHLNISTTGSSSKTPKVKITRAPVRIKKSTGAINMESGNTTIDGKTLFYTKKDGVVSYFNEAGLQVDSQGQTITDAQQPKPSFYFNGEKIAPTQAHALMRNNRSIQVTTKDISKLEYAVILTDLSKTSLADPNNKNNNANAFIDLTEMISKGAQFFYNDDPISTEKALWLTKNVDIERVNTIGSKKGAPKVYFWKKV